MEFRLILTKFTLFSIIVKNSQWHSFEQVIMQYFNGCVYTAGTRKADKEVDAPSEDELKHVQVEGLVKHLCEDYSFSYAGRRSAGLRKILILN